MLFVGDNMTDEKPKTRDPKGWTRQQLQDEAGRALAVVEAALAFGEPEDANTLFELLEIAMARLANLNSALDIINKPILGNE